MSLAAADTLDTIFRFRPPVVTSVTLGSGNSDNVYL
jgi:hypothetical protein